MRGQLRRRPAPWQSYDTTASPQRPIIPSPRRPTQVATALRNLETDLLASTALVAALANYGEGGNPESADRAMQAFEQFMQVRKGKRDGWLRFCENIGVSADAITARFIEHAEDAMDMAIGFAESLEADNAEGLATAERIAARELEGLLDAWEDIP